MPKKPIDLTQAKVYRIVSPSTGEQYIGSTCNVLSKRMAQHRDGFRKWEQDNFSAYCRSYEVLKHGDANIFLMETVECKTRDDLFRREGEIMMSTNCVNRCIPGKLNLHICEHNKTRYSCRKCKGPGICQHGHSKNSCLECDGPEVQKITCECGHMVRKCYMKEHLKSALHHKRMDPKYPGTKCECTSMVSVADMSAHLKSEDHKTNMRLMEDVQCECGLTYQRYLEDLHKRRQPHKTNMLAMVGAS
jgi:hypothetical protein